jgi:hypothetical protein
MPRKSKRQKRPEEEHTHLAIRVERCEASVEAAVNYNVYTPQSGVSLEVKPTRGSVYPMTLNPTDMKVRLSAELRKQVEEAARTNNRTLNAEIFSRLEMSFAKPPDAPMERRMRALEKDYVSLAEFADFKFMCATFWGGKLVRTCFYRREFADQLAEVLDRPMAIALNNRGVRTGCGGQWEVSNVRNCLTSKSRAGLPL